MDSRALVFLVILGPALGWVAFNILQPGLNQLNNMQEKNAKRKGLAAGVGGLSAAALMGMPEAADAATEAMQLADLDARIAIFGAFVPVLGWVGYNILGPGLKQLEKMQQDAAKKKGVAAGVGLSAAALMGMPEAADAATEAMQLADLDARIAIFGAFVPVLGWVGYNILGPGLKQLEKMQQDAAKKKGVAAGVGLSAAALMGMPEAADAATEAMQLADLDARIAIFGAFVPVLGWVGYNILGPGLKQLEKMQQDAAKKKGVAAGVGLSAAALMGMPEAADAATEAMQTSTPASPSSVLSCPSLAGLATTSLALVSSSSRRCSRMPPRRRVWLRVLAFLPLPSWECLRLLTPPPRPCSSLTSTPASPSSVLSCPSLAGLATTSLALVSSSSRRCSRMPPRRRVWLRVLAFLPLPSWVCLRPLTPPPRPCSSLTSTPASPSSVLSCPSLAGLATTSLALVSSSSRRCSRMPLRRSKC